MQDIAEFFVLFQTMEAGFVARAREVERLLTDDGTTFVVVSTAESAPLREARFMVDELQRRRMPLGAVVLNRVLPRELRQTGATKAAARLAAVASDADAVGRIATATRVPADELGGLLAEIGERFRETSVVAAREAERRRELEAVVPLVVPVPLMAGDVHDINGLVEIGRHLLT